MEDLIYEFDSSVDKANYIFEMSLNAYIYLEEKSIMMYENDDIDKDNLINNNKMNKDSFVDSVVNFVKKIIQVIKSFCDKIVLRIKSKIQSNQIKNKLKSFKESLINNKQAANCDITIFDINRYLKDYDKWIDWEITETNKLLSTDFKTPDDLDYAIEELEKKSTAYRNKLSITDKEAYALTIKIGEAITYTEKQLDDIERLTRLSETWGSGVKKIEYVYLKKPEPKKVYLLKARINNINNTCKAVISTVATALMKILSAIQSAVKKLIAGILPDIHISFEG